MDERAERVAGMLKSMVMVLNEDPEAGAYIDLRGRLHQPLTHGTTLSTHRNPTKILSCACSKCSQASKLSSQSGACIPSKLPIQGNLNARLHKAQPENTMLQASADIVQSAL